MIQGCNGAKTFAVVNGGAKAIAHGTAPAIRGKPTIVFVLVSITVMVSTKPLVTYILSCIGSNAMLAQQSSLTGLMGIGEPIT